MFFWLLIFENNKKFNKIHQNTFFSKQPNACFILPFFRWCKEELSQNEELRGEKNDEVEKLQVPTWTNLFSTPWKINMEPPNGGLEDDFHFLLGEYEVPC